MEELEFTVGEGPCADAFRDGALVRCDTQAQARLGVREVSLMSAHSMAATFVELADTLVADFDPLDFMHLLADRCVDLLGVDAAGLLLVDHSGRLRVVGASSERARLLELFELQNSQGPCLECYRTGVAVIVSDLEEMSRLWPEFSRVSGQAGFTSVHALPMRLRSEVIGALNLFHAAPGALDEAALKMAQAMADVATIGLLQERAISRRELLAEQLEGALHSRVLIEQAKGVLAGRLQLDMDTAFSRLRNYSRHHNMRISAVAEDLVSGELDARTLLGLR
ncbi:GAF and ANTAR domain-containing protein [Kutzneria viridogrisea]